MTLQKIKRLAELSMPQQHHFEITTSALNTPDENENPFHSEAVSPIDALAAATRVISLRRASRRAPCSPIFPRHSKNRCSELSVPKIHRMGSNNKLKGDADMPPQGRHRRQSSFAQAFPTASRALERRNIGGATSYLETAAGKIAISGQTRRDKIPLKLRSVMYKYRTR